MHLIHQLLTGEGRAKELFVNDPSPDAPPTWVRASLYRYRFAASDELGWWIRERVAGYVVPLRADDPRLREAVRSYGWR